MQLGIGIGPSFGQKTMLQRAINILRKYGTAAHYWDFGISQEKLAYGATHTAAEFLARYPLHHLFQDSAGTLPLYAIGQPCGLVKDPFGGAHASQSTTTKRPILGARYNLLTATENIATWVLTNVSGTATRVGNTITFGANAIDRCIAPGGSTIVSGASYKRSVTLSGSGTVRLFTFDSTGSSLMNELVELTSTPKTYTTTATLVNGGVAGRIGIYNNAAGTAGAVVNFVNADLRPANSPQNIPAYQRVTSATDYDTVGFPARLVWDGVDDCLVVPVLDLSETDKVTVIAGVGKLSDAAAGAVYEHSININTNNGAFYLIGPSASAAGDYQIGVKGTTPVNVTRTGCAAPNSSVVTARASISAPSIDATVNRVKSTQSTSSLGTGNFRSDAFYIGQRAGTSLPFNGSLQSIAVIGNLMPDGEVKLLEDLTNKAMGKVY